MPTYDYLCQSCGHDFELFQQITASAKKRCPQCGMMSLQRLIGTGSGVLFKGSGFYQTDYRSESYKKGAKADSGNGSSCGGGSGGDSKPATSTTSSQRESPSTSSDTKKD